MVQGAKVRVRHFFWPFGTFVCHCRSNNEAAKSSNLSINIWKTPIPDEKFSISPHSCSKFMTLWLLGKNSEMINYPPQEKRFRRMQVHFFWAKNQCLQAVLATSISWNEQNMKKTSTKSSLEGRNVCNTMFWDEELFNFFVHICIVFYKPCISIAKKIKFSTSPWLAIKL